jgi:hypothetical protein
MGAAKSVVDCVKRSSGIDVKAWAMGAGCSTSTEVVTAEGCWWGAQQMGLSWLRGACWGHSPQEA